jgi:GTP cyclohydrolase I
VLKFISYQEYTTIPAMSMEDVQNHSPTVALNIDTVGVRNLKLPLLVRDRSDGSQQTVAKVDLGVDLPSAFKGTHMSRFMEALNTWDDEISYQSVRRLLQTIKERLGAQRAYARFCFPYFVRKLAPVSASGGLVPYECRLTGELDENGQSFLLEIDVTVMTVCPCSKAISDEGAHSQRALVRMSIRMTEFSWMEEFIEIAEESGSSAVYTLLKREDEKFVTERAFANPRFVEDVVRNVAQQLTAHERVSWFRVEVESMESIHSHNAFASIERSCR